MGYRLGCLTNRISGCLVWRARMLYFGAPVTCSRRGCCGFECSCPGSLPSSSSHHRVLFSGTGFLTGASLSDFLVMSQLPAFSFAMSTSGFSIQWDSLPLSSFLDWGRSVSLFCGSESRYCSNVCLHQTNADACQDPYESGQILAGRDLSGGLKRWYVRHEMIL